MIAIFSFLAFSFRHYALRLPTAEKRFIFVAKLRPKQFINKSI